jgi:murein DD-endopeptidase MepM/ murein hydrolase activator NlpD
LKIQLKTQTTKATTQNHFGSTPWGRSGVHKGVDIFAKKGTVVKSSTGGLVIFKGEIEMGGNVVVIIWTAMAAPQLRSPKGH